MHKPEAADYYYYGNIYYHPEKWGVEQIAFVDDPMADYSFDMMVAWKEVEGDGIYIASDYGCSCPSPFESYTEIEDFFVFEDTVEGRAKLDKFVAEWMGYYTVEERPDLEALRNDFRMAVLKAS